MIKYCLLFLVLWCSVYSAKADHITGGEMYYVLIGRANGQFQYSVTMKLFMRCNSGRQFNNPSVIGVFEKGNNNRIMDIPVSLSRIETIRLNNPSRCITDPPTVCYEVGYYEFIVSLPASNAGYVITGQVVFRVAGIKNLILGYGSIGATYTAEIPSNAVSDGPANSSAHFTGSDLVIICADNSFTYSFAASDNDGDELRYSFCEAYQGGNGGANNSNPPQPPPYQSVPYSSNFGNARPLGSQVNIDQKTGLITGTAPPEAGVYVVTVCVEEVRRGTVIATQRKDIQIAIAPCTVAEAKLKEVYMLCGDTKTITLYNLSTSPLINSQNWQLVHPNGTVLFTSRDPVISYTFPDTGTYAVRLAINSGQECSDSTNALIRVYPGFNPNFTYAGVCYSKPTRFTNLTTTVYGVVNFWSWEFGEFGPVSTATSPQYTYQTVGNKLVRLVTGNSVGCLDTVEQAVGIADKPPIQLAFRDTLICVNDEVQLKAAGSGNFIWSPLRNIINFTTPNPTVKTAVTTVYYVDLDDEGCLNRDSVRVRVTNKVNLQVMNDTTICEGDPITLKVQSDGFIYSWIPASQMQDPRQKNPTAITRSNTLYQVTASIGSCQAVAAISVRTVPYPSVNAGKDTMICFNTTANLHADIIGNNVKWLPDANLSNAGSLNPVARPASTTAYICYAIDNKGCPKPGTDTVIVRVLPEVVAFAGRDTTVVIGQSLQLNASGGIRYEWSPSVGLSSTKISNPVAVYQEPEGGIRYKLVVYNEAGCVDSAYVRVKVFKTLPSIFVPNAFTPNGDGVNDILRPVSAGLRKIDYFNIYNRWGQLVFSGAETSQGWDGSIGGKPQASGSFVWMVKATDHTGAAYMQKGTVTLIR